MPRSNQTHHDLDEIHELNGLFLDFLRARAQAGRDCLGLRHEAIGLLKTAPPDLIEAITRFPAALFRLDLESARPRRVLDPAAAMADPALLAVQLGILQAARRLSRDRAYAARLYLRLSEPELERLAALTLGELGALASLPRVVSCAYAECDWLWSGLLSETRPEARRDLLLLGLQPAFDLVDSSAGA